MNYKKAIGMRGEELASKHLEAVGFSIIGRNIHISHDEIDIIAEDEKYIVFCEVKTRAQTESNKRYGRPAAAVDYQKKQKLIRAVTKYMRSSKIKKQPRIDVIEVYFPPMTEQTPIDISGLIPISLKHIRNAVHK